ncbi:LysR family transcriptional regulator ArgP [Allorhizobium undicola]|uniref:LysR family transcriptional regulator ArgP n=1 Tax=Allorhizobium undicola TaxID=78527 RepID=UPI003D32D5C0
MMDYGQMEAVSAVLRSGSFERAARLLHITPSAVSQRVKALEDQLGIALIIREKPCQATEAGTMVAMHFERVSLLQRSLETQLSIENSALGQSVIRIAVNADSVETWFLKALAPDWPWLYDLVIDDQHHSAEWLRKGLVTAAVTAEGNPVTGCDSRPLGALRYRAVCSPSFHARWMPDGLTPDAAGKAPALVYGNKDELHSNWLSACLDYDRGYPFHQLPSTTAITNGVCQSLGWALVPEILAVPYIEAGDLVELAPEHKLDVPLFWQWSRAVSPALMDLNTAVVKTAAQHLHPVAEACAHNTPTRSKC